MKRILKKLFLISAILSTVTLPLIFTSCGNEKNEIPKKDIDKNTNNDPNNNTYGHNSNSNEPKHSYSFNDGHKVIMNGILVKWDNAEGDISDENITKIGRGAFKGVTHLTSVNFPNVSEIGDSAF
ncbi:variable surface lipoprotein [[Mycoplasma] gypis]|uniref:Variable surface lipoprotein n=1 Tax=[Mycoplasma] gypis TaxID=92404 RepID=A0ABZ2RMJ3_9BACT|nr:variable surface lipoprotein [[Mycoplasma] gypis]MBN0919068.1 variable surface lipoprotein [[Mycoplasma] gypis]